MAKSILPAKKNVEEAEKQVKTDAQNALSNVSDMMSNHPPDKIKLNYKISLYSKVINQVMSILEKKAPELKDIKELKTIEKIEQTHQNKRPKK